VIFLTQLIPSGAYPIRRELRVLTYQALINLEAIYILPLLSLFCHFFLDF